MPFAKKGGFEDRLFLAIAVLNCLTIAFILAIYFYGGLYSRYLADDYCGSAILKIHGNFVSATLAGYQTWFNSYSRLFFMQLSDWAGLWGIRLFPGITLVLLTVSLMWLFIEIVRTIFNRASVLIGFWLAGLTVFLSLYQTPALYQILYWRTGSIPYTLPLIFFAGIAAFLLWYVRQPFQRSRAVWVAVLCFVLVFFAGGFSETTSAFQVGLLFLAVVMAWLTRSLHRRTDVLSILSGALFLAVLALLITAFSPGTSTRLDRIMTNPPLYNPFDLSLAVIVYTGQFLWDNLKVTPLPIAVAWLSPFFMAYAQSINREDQSKILTRHLLYAALILLVLMFVTIGFSYAPSAFARTYPAARARFASHVLMNLTFVLEGGLLGILASRIRLPIRPSLARGIALLLLFVLSIYPIRASAKPLTAQYEYRNFAAAWDIRDAEIREAIANGATDLVVVQLDSIAGVGEYKGNERDWINRCAAQFYGLNTLRAP